MRLASVLSRIRVCVCTLRTAAACWPSHRALCGEWRVKECLETFKKLGGSAALLKYCLCHGGFWPEGLPGGAKRGQAAARNPRRRCLGSGA